MAPKKKISLVLLTLCIALVSAPGYTAGGGDPVNPMPMDCVDCDMHRDGGDNACHGSACMLLTEYCGGLYPFSLPPRAMAAPLPAPALQGWPAAAVSIYRSRFDFSIFRPPIA